MPGAAENDTDGKRVRAETWCSDGRSESGGNGLARDRRRGLKVEMDKERQLQPCRGERFGGWD